MPLPSESQTLPLTLRCRVDRICDAFESAWLAGSRPTIEDHLGDAAEPARGEILRELVLLDAHYRRAAGEPVQAEDYLGRFPALDRAWLASTLVARARDGAAGPPGYEILGVVGRGGMGLIYRANQPRLRRTVALKMILPSPSITPEDHARFQAEAEAIAALDHPNVVRIFEIGEHEGRPYFAMEYVAGGNLADRLAGAPLPPAEAARLVATLARAVEAAHRRGVVHRDLKPANVLLAEDGTPKITDFGLAKRLDEDSGLTRSGSLLGTPCYMAPEQAAGEGRRVGPATDVYALGAILYEALTGRPPFRGATVLDTLQMVRHQEPVPPRRLQPKVPRDLETIGLTCLHKDPSRRYSSAAALADDLGRFLDGRTIRARPAPAWEHAVRWSRRRPAVAALLGLLALAVVALLAGGAWFTQKLRRERDASDAARSAALAEHKSSRRSAYAAQLLLAHDSWLDNRVGRTLELLEIAARPSPVDPTDLRGWEWPFLRGLCRQDDATLPAPGPGARSVAYSPDGSLLAVGGQDGRIVLWDARGLRSRAERRAHPKGVASLAFSPDGKALASCGDDGAVRLWGLPDLRELWTRPGHAPESALRVAFRPDGRVLASGGRDSKARLWDVATGEPVGIPLRHEKLSTVHSIAFRPDGRMLATGGTDGEINLWDGGPEPARVLKASEGQILALAFTPDGKTLATGSYDGAVRLWDPDSGALKAEWRGPIDRVHDLAIAPDGRTLATVSNDTVVRLWDLETRSLLRSYRGHTGMIWGVAFRPDGRALATAGGDGAVKLWRAEPGAEDHRVLPVEITEVRALAYSGDGRLLAGAGVGPGVVLWDPDTGRVVRTLDGATKQIYGLEFRPDGRLLAAGCHEGVIRLWDPDSGRLFRTLPGPRAFVMELAFHPGGRFLAASVKDGNVRVWDLDRDEAPRTLPTPEMSEAPLAFRPDGSELAVGRSDGLIKLYTFPGLRERASFAAHPKDLQRVAYSPDGRLLASCAKDERVKLWDARTGALIREVRGHAGGVTGLAFSPDGRRLLTRGNDLAIRLWDVESGLEVLGLRGHSDILSDAVFRPDGRQIASSAMTAIRLWDAPPDRQ